MIEDRNAVRYQTTLIGHLGGNLPSDVAVHCLVCPANLYVACCLSMAPPPSRETLWMKRGLARNDAIFLYTDYMMTSISTFHFHIVVVVDNNLIHSFWVVSPNPTRSNMGSGTGTDTSLTAFVTTNHSTADPTPDYEESGEPGKFAHARRRRLCRIFHFHPDRHLDTPRLVELYPSSPQVLALLSCTSSCIAW